MTEPHESANTRPISVAELLAKNGTIGAPVPNRRRRRRGNSDAVTVAELTGEIPIIDDDIEPEATGQSTPEPHAQRANGSARLDEVVSDEAPTKSRAFGPNPSRGGRNRRHLVRVNHGRSRGNRAPSAALIRCRRATMSASTPAVPVAPKTSRRTDPAPRG